MENLYRKTFTKKTDQKFFISNILATRDDGIAEVMFFIMLLKGGVCFARK